MPHALGYGPSEYKMDVRNYHIPKPSISRPLNLYLSPSENYVTGSFSASIYNYGLFQAEQLANLSTGVLAANGLIEADGSKISVATLQPGIYVCQIQIDAETTLIEKLIIR